MRVTLIADEVTALGWRLIGARVLLPSASSAVDCWHDALRDSDLVVITAQYTAAIAPAELEAALLAAAPLVLVIADLRGREQPPDMQLEVRRALGVSA